ncbi:hypothetical protein [Streptomyces prasinus]|uniref:hypothetical protein n=1 Tax=Streptomyces prasinus TaxID=67345 RepID=UPI003691F92A
MTNGPFVVSAAVAVVGQLRLTGWAKNRWQPGEALVRGPVAMGLAFVPSALSPRGSAPAVLMLLVTAVIPLAAGSAIVHPFEMDTVVARLPGGRRHRSLRSSSRSRMCRPAGGALLCVWVVTRGRCRVWA